MSVQFLWTNTDQDLPTGQQVKPEVDPWIAPFYVVAAPVLLRVWEFDQQSDRPVDTRFDDTFFLPQYTAPPPTLLRVWEFEEGGRPTPTTPFGLEDTYYIPVSLAPPPPCTFKPWDFDVQEVSHTEGIDDGGWVPLFTASGAGPYLIDPAGFANDEVTPGPPSEIWNVLSILGLPPAPPPPVQPLTYGWDDEFSPFIPAIAEEPWDIRGLLGLPLPVPGPVFPPRDGWLDDLVPTPPLPIIDDSDGPCYFLLLVATPPPLGMPAPGFTFDPDFVAPTGGGGGGIIQMILLQQLGDL